MSEREEYLDELLKGVDSNAQSQTKQTTEGNLLDDYDKELEGIDEDDFLREFERDLGDELDLDLDSDFETEFAEEKFPEKDFQEAFPSESNSASEDFSYDIDNIVNNVKNGNLEDNWNDGDLSIEESLQDYEEDPVMDEIGNEFGIEDSYGMEESFGMEEPAEELSEAEQLAREIEGLNLESEEEKPDKAKVAPKAEAEAEAAEGRGEKPKKKGLFRRFTAALFGEDDEETSANGDTVKVDNIENMSEEELAALMEMENANAAAAEEEKAKKQQKEEEKKALKEQKAKEKAEKKAEKKALKEQKAKEKAEKKALQKSQEPVEKSKPLPKKPVVLIILFGLSIVVLVCLLSNLSGYNAALSNAKSNYERGQYVEAYSYLSKKEMKEGDLPFYDRVRLTAYLQQQLKSYDTYQSQKMYDEALGALICCVGRYDRFLKEAENAGVEREYEKMFQTIQADLQSVYQMSIEEARAIYALEDKKEFSYAVHQAVDELGLSEEE